MLVEAIRFFSSKPKLEKGIAIKLSFGLEEPTEAIVGTVDSVEEEGEDDEGDEDKDDVLVFNSLPFTERPGFRRMLVDSFWTLRSSLGWAEMEWDVNNVNKSKKQSALPCNSKLTVNQFEACTSGQCRVRVRR